MISKELLSEILDIGLDYVSHKLVDNQIEYKFESKDEQYGFLLEEEINVYELAHKCKEWALGLKTVEDYSKYLNGFELSTKLIMKDCFPYQCICEVSYRTKYKNSIRQEKCLKIAESEPKAILKACEWILKSNLCK